MKSEMVDKITRLQEMYFYKYMNGEMEFQQFYELMSICETELQEEMRNLRTKATEHEILKRLSL